MMRERISIGATITLYSGDAPKKFQIDEVIGDGASCIVYEAHCIDGSQTGLRYRIKECYPYHAKIERNGLSLAWDCTEEKESAFARFQNAHKLILELCNDPAVGNNITTAELYSGNGTLYSVMVINHAQTYANDHDTNLHSILDTMRVLTETIGQLHQKGYLHLDIKPDNFLVTHHPSTNIWLFDVDSLTAMADLKEGKIQPLSYSQGWAAPEQMLGQTNKICEATDLFAIGSILFKKVMGRPVSNDDMGLFADWNFDSPLFDEVNPKVKRILRAIFKNTLAASVKRRYQNANELLKEIQRSYLSSTCLNHL